MTPIDGEHVIDADGLVLSPGFIDMHAHSDLQLLVNPAHPAKLTQGVTTEVLGQDGLSYAPVDDEVLAMVRRQDRRLERPTPADFDFSWRSVGEYLDRLDRDGIADQRRLPGAARHAARAGRRLGRPAGDARPRSSR